MVAALRSQFGPLPDQSMHEKTTVANLIEEIYTFLKQADARELRHLFTELDEARENGGDVDGFRIIVCRSLHQELGNQLQKLSK